MKTIVDTQAWHIPADMRLASELFPFAMYVRGVRALPTPIHPGAFCPWPRLPWFSTLAYLVPERTKREGV